VGATIVLIMRPEVEIVPTFYGIRFLPQGIPFILIPPVRTLHIYPLALLLSLVPLFVHMPDQHPPTGATSLIIICYRIP
jgi:hypothetical protein